METALNLKDMEFEKRFQVVRLIEAVDGVRRLAHSISKEMDDMQHWAEDTEALYRRVTEAYGIEPKSVFDADEHIRGRVAEGHPDFAPYENSHAAPHVDISPASREETADEAVGRLQAAGWDFTLRMSSWDADDDDWRDEIDDLMAYNFNPGEIIRKRGTQKSGEVTQVLVDSEGEITFLANGIGMVPACIADDARNPHHFWGILSINPEDGSIHAIEPAKNLDDKTKVWRIEGTPERPFMHLFGARSREQLVENMNKAIQGRCIVGEFAVIPSSADPQAAVLAVGLDVEHASDQDEEVALEAIADFMDATSNPAL